MNKKSKKHKKKVPKSYSGDRVKNQFHQSVRQKRISKHHRSSSFSTIKSGRSHRLLSIQEKGLSDSFASKTVNSRVPTDNDLPKTSNFRRWMKLFCILVGIATVGVLGYIAVSWIIEKTATDGDPSLSGKTSNDGELDKEDNFFAIDEITNFPSISSYPTTQAPSAHPTLTRSSAPSNYPTNLPSSFPSSVPSNHPTTVSSLAPSVSLLPSASQTPSYAPTENPTTSSSPTVIEWYQVGNDIKSDGVIFSSDISGNGDRLIIGVPNYSNNLGKIEIYELKEGQWGLVKAFVSRSIDYDILSADNMLTKYFGLVVRISSDGNFVAVHSMTESYYNVIVAFEEKPPGVWRAGITGDASICFDLSDNRFIDYGHMRRAVIHRLEVTEFNNMFRIRVHNNGGRDETLDMIDDANVIWSMSTSDSGSRIVVGRPAYTRVYMGMPISKSGRIDVYDLVSIVNPDSGASDLFATRVEKDGDQSHDGFLGSGLFERKGDVVKLSGDGTTVLVGGYMQRQYSSPEITQTPFPSLYGLPYIEVWFYDASEGWMKRGQRLNAPSTTSAWGVACAISTNGNLIAVGDEIYNDIGLVKVFQYDGENWSQLGQTFYGTTYERWGKTVAFSSSVSFPRLIITSITKDNNSTVRVLEYGVVN